MRVREDVEGGKEDEGEGVGGRAGVRTTNGGERRTNGCEEEDKRAWKRVGVDRTTTRWVPRDKEEVDNDAKGWTTTSGESTRVATRRARTDVKRWAQRASERPRKANGGRGRRVVCVEAQKGRRVVTSSEGEEVEVEAALTVNGENFPIGKSLPHCKILSYLLHFVDDI
ncbi:hypothetical protein CPC08DRAFT_730870 [Agrocybe pediades]|nr:hypothetical protein CPC08DRAFT_730870 [Agrocybe pediades]